MRKLTHDALVLNQASPAAIVAAITDRPLWTPDQVECYKHDFAVRNQISYPVQVFAGMAAAFVDFILLVGSAFAFMRGRAVDAELDGDFVTPTEQNHLRDIAYGKHWMQSDIIDDARYIRGGITHALPARVTEFLGAIRQFFPDARASIHTFATDPILQVEVTVGSVTHMMFPLVWDIDADGQVVFIDPPTE